jgi:4-hydroxybenzoate polyprenyltransferase
MRGKKGVQQFWVVFFLFFMTGLAIVLYLNQTPEQPRERDYAYAGSFYAYAIWCGMGVAALIEMIWSVMKKNQLVSATIIGAAALLVPLQMASQTWDDHDRSGRYTCRDFGQNYLMSLQEEGNPHRLHQWR